MSDFSNTPLPSSSGSPSSQELPGFESAETPPPPAPLSPLAQLENTVREHPVVSVLAGVGLGCLLGVALRDLLTPPSPPKYRALRLLEDIQHQLAALAEPAYKRAGHFAEDGMSAVKKGVDSLSDLDVSGKVKRWLN